MGGWLGAARCDDGLKTTVRRDAGQKDLIHALVVTGAKAHGDAAEIYRTQPDKGCQKALPGEVGARFFQGYESQTTGQVPLKGYKARLGGGVDGCQCSLVLCNHRDRVIPRERDHLADDHVLASITQFLGQCVRSDKGDMHEGRVELDLARQSDEFRHRFISANHDHGIWFGFADG